jgi:lipopolysaccharide export system protein LptC
LQVPQEKGVIDLDHPEGEVTLNSGAWLAGKSKYGRYDQDNKKLWLGGDVRLFHDQGYEFSTPEMYMDMNDNNAWGSEAVVIQGSFGEIHGTGFRLLDDGKIMIVTGRPKALLHLRNHSPSGSNEP